MGKSLNMKLNEEQVRKRNEALAAGSEQAPQGEEADDLFSSVTHWQDIQAQNDTNKKIIFKFMRKGFTSLSAEELACTMVNPDFTIDFKNVTNED